MLDKYIAEAMFLASSRAASISVNSRGLTSSSTPEILRVTTLSFGINFFPKYLAILVGCVLGTLLGTSLLLNPATAGAILASHILSAGVK